MVLSTMCVMLAARPDGKNARGDRFFDERLRRLGVAQWSARSGSGDPGTQ